MGVAPLLCVSAGRSSCKGDGRAKHALNLDVSGAFRCSRILKLSSLRFQHGCMGPSQSPAVRSEHLRGKMKIFGKKHFISSLSYCLLAPCQSMCSMLVVPMDHSSHAPLAWQSIGFHSAELLHHFVQC